MNSVRVLASTILLLCASASGRTWTCSEGTRTFEGDFLAFDAEKEIVMVRLANGATSSFKIGLLSDEDVAFVKSGPKPMPRGARVKVKAVPENLPRPDGKMADITKPVQVFILMGQSNMLGFGKVSGDGAHTLELAVKEGKYPYLVDDEGHWTVRKDVRNVRVMNFKDYKTDWLTPADTKAIGPEIGFGSIMGEAIEAPVLVLKSCIGNRSLGWDLLPPGSERFDKDGTTFAGYKDPADKWPTGTDPKAGGWYAGKQYDDDVASAKKVLENLDQYYPGATHYDIVGFVFWQGDKDRYNAVHAENYEKNLVRLIEALREDFEAPNAKFVCASLGQTKKGSGGNEGMILEGVLAVDGGSGKYPEFKGNVASVYAHPLSMGSSSNAHYGGHAQTYMNVGEALGRAMVKLLAE